MTSDSTNPFEVCAAEGYNASDALITELARIGASGDAVTSRVGGTYLKVIVARSKNWVDSYSGCADGDAVNLVNHDTYKAVLAGVTTADCAPIDGPTNRAENARRSLERNRRSNFARTAVSTLRTWLAVSGGKLADLDPALVTKANLIEAINVARAKARDTLVAGSVGDAASPLPLNDMERKAALAYRRLYAALTLIKRGDAARAKFLSDKITTALISTFEDR